MAVNSTSTVVSRTNINLTPNQIYTVKSNDGVITGSTGTETVIVLDSTNNVTLLGSLENINLSGGIFNYGFFQNGKSGVYLYNNSGQLLAMIGSSTSGVHVNFGDKSSLTLSVNSSGYEQIHYDKVQLIPNLNVYLPNGNITILGANNDILSIPSGILGVVADANVGQFNVSASLYSSATLSSSGNVLNVLDASNNKVLSWSVGAANNQTLEFNNAIGVLGLNASGIAQFTLKDYLIGVGQSYTLTQSGVNVFGNTGNETLVLNATDRQELIDSNVEKVSLPGKMSTYTWKTSSGVIDVFDSSNVLVAGISVEKTSSGTALQFADQTVNAKLVPSGISVFNSAGQVLNSSSSSPVTIPVSGSNSASNTGSSVASTSHFAYTLDWSQFSSSAANQSAVQACLTAAINKIGSYLNAKGSLDIQVLTQNTSSNVLAQASPAMVSIPSSLQGTAHGANASTEFLVESQTGQDANSGAPDASVYINMTDFSQFNLNPNQSPAASQFDLTTILEHEMIHALGFSGEIGTSSNLKTQFDTFVSTANGQPYFTGPHAEAIYGGPVPLAPASAGSGSAYYHVNIPSDLMYDGIGPGQVKSISALDVAMLQDLGAPVLVGVSA
jgi:hypothetical protein